MLSPTTTVSMTASVRNLGIHNDSDVSMKSHVSKTVSLFCSTSSDQEHTAMYSTASAAFTGRVAGTLTARLRLRCTGWSTSQHHRETAVGAECCSTPCVFVMEVRPCDDTPSTNSLVEDGAADRVQAGSTCLPLLPLSVATVPCERPSNS